MTLFVLILNLLRADGTGEELAVGIFRDGSACTVAAAGMKIVLEDANPGLTVTARCQPQGEPA